MSSTIQKFQRSVARSRLRATDFSIVSNNCWGAHIYQTLKLPFATPFIGLFLSPASYLRLLANFRKNLLLPLKFKTVSDEAWVNRMREAHTNQWPIGSLGDEIEIQFMHYHSPAEADEKWRRRSARLAAQPEKLFFKFCDRDGCTAEQLAAFEQLPFRNKVFFTTQQDCPLRFAVKIPLPQTCVPDGLTLSQISPAYFDSVDWLNGGSGQVRWWGKKINCI